MAISLNELQERIGYRFGNVSFLERAITHSSYSNETGARNHHLLCNERLEFLGDSVLSLVVSNYLYTHFSEYPEGTLTRIRSAVVCEAALASFAEKIGLGEFLLLGRGEAQNGGAQKPAILADAFEALLAAIYLDAGAEDGMQSVAKFLLPLVKSAMDALPEMGDVRIDSKSRLQEFIQQDREQKEVLEYRLVGESGPDHNKTFTVDLYLGANCIGSGKGHSKKAAEQAAAKAALSLFGLI
ncbi:MAG: ribonuclease III [Ruminococcaceae bacterium]|nr:ribonuclease III [Oscillospiraceae bacterium]